MCRVWGLCEGEVVLALYSGALPSYFYRVWMGGRVRELHVVCRNKQRSGSITIMCVVHGPKKHVPTFRFVLLVHTFHPTTHNTGGGVSSAVPMNKSQHRVAA